LAANGKGHASPDGLVDDLFDYLRGAATRRRDQSRAATSTSP
jgi:hypothetical protein